MRLYSLRFPRRLHSRTCASPPQRGTSAVEPNAYAEPTHMNCCPFKSRMIVGSAAPIAFCIHPIVFSTTLLTESCNEGLTSSTAVKSREDARENMMHQNFQFFGTPSWISAEQFSRNVLETLGDSSGLDEESIAMLLSIVPQE